MAVGYFIIAILGCADGSTQCTPVMTAPTRYESEAACTAAAPDVLTANAKFDFPSLFAECRPVKTPAAAEKVDRPSPGPTRKA